MPRRGLTVDNYWKKVILKDEGTIKVGQRNRVWVWKQTGEGSFRSDLYGSNAESKNTRVQVNVWGSITWHGQGILKVFGGNINALVYISIVDECLWPVVSNFFCNGHFIYQEVNAPIHKAKVVKKYMMQNNINVLSWPAYSSDLNQIETCWSLLKQCLQKEIHLTSSQDNLDARIQRIWRALPFSYFKGLYNSILKRLRNVTVLKGHLTKY